MKKNEGWIKLHRQIQESSIWDNGEPFDMAHAWIDLLLCANHDRRERIIQGNVVVVYRGEIFASETFFANRWHWSRGKVRRFFANIEAANMVTLKRTPNGTRVFIVNYSNFQGTRTTDGTADGTTDGTTDGTEYKNYKNYKNVKNTSRTFQNFQMSSTDWNGLAEQIIEAQQNVTL